MKRFLILLIFTVSGLTYTNYAQNVTVSPWVVQLSRDFARDIFEMNAVPYTKPMVEAVNATSNARFYSAAYVPVKVDKPYFRISVNAMLGFTPDDKKTYQPEVPGELYNISDLTNYARYSNGNIYIQDTAGLVHYLFKTILYDYQKLYPEDVPGRAPTLLGSGTSELTLNPDGLKYAAQHHPLWSFLSDSMKALTLSTLGGLPTFFTLPAGGNLNTILAGIPQIEIGSLWGTEALIRLIPPIDMGSNIGEFMFWGIGLKHNLTQYLGNAYQQESDRPFDAAIQFVYQGTHLKNTIGVTNAQLEANGTFLDLNLHVSKTFGKNFSVFAGLASEYINIDSKFKYYLPVEVQYQIGLLYPNDPNPRDGYPGDQNPQTSTLQIDDTSLKGTFGVSYTIGSVGIVADYSISKFNIFSGGISYTF